MFGNKMKSLVVYLYVIRDNIAEEYGPVFQAVNDKVAWRSFKQSIRETVHPTDYTLWLIGSIDKDADIQRLVPTPVDEYISEDV